MYLNLQDEFLSYTHFLTVYLGVYVHCLHHAWVGFGLADWYSVWAWNSGGQNAVVSNLDLKIEWKDFIYTVYNVSLKCLLRMNAKKFTHAIGQYKYVV